MLDPEPDPTASLPAHKLSAPLPDWQTTFPTPHKPQIALGVEQDLCSPFRSDILCKAYMV